MAWVESILAKLVSMKLVSMLTGAIVWIEVARTTLIRATLELVAMTALTEMKLGILFEEYRRQLALVVALWMLLSFAGFAQ